MATTPTAADVGPLAIGPASLNIFAKPAEAQRKTSPGARLPRGVFDEASGCDVSERAVGLVAGSDDGSARHGRTTTSRRLACLLLLVAAAAAGILAFSSHKATQDAVTAPPAGSPRDWRHPRSSPAPRRRRARPRARAHGTTRIRHAPSRARRATSSGPRTEKPARGPAAPAPSTVDRRPAVGPARPIPNRVAPDAPPEFM